MQAHLMTTITTKGQVTIPETVRRAIGASIGDKVSFTGVSADTKEVTMKIVSSRSIEELYGSLKNSVVYVPHDKARRLAAKYLAKRYS